MILIRLCVDGVCGLTPELSRPARGEPGGAEAAKRARLERVVSAMKLALMSEAPVSCRLRQRKETVAARRRIRSEICRSAGQEPQLLFLEAEERIGLATEPRLSL